MCGLYDSGGAELGAQLGDDNDGVVKTYTGWGSNASPRPTPTPALPPPPPVAETPLPPGGGTCRTESIIRPNPFMGRTDELVTLSGGTMWKVGASFESLNAFNPTVSICPDERTLRVESKSFPVTPLIWNVVSIITSQFGGFSHGNLYTLANGQVWEQTEAYTWTWTWTWPEVTIYQESGRFFMKVQNIDHHVSVQQVSP
jgi:hypothetical protein